MPKVSVLVAVYNTKQYLSQCLDSLLRQTLRDIQIICIDDASTDGSDLLLKQYADKDSRIIVLSNETNQGPSNSRNQGITHATGEYMCFLDSDDWFDDDALEKMVTVMESEDSIDSVLFRLVKHYEGTGVVEQFKNDIDGVLTGEEAFLKSINWNIHGVALTRTDLFRTIPFDTTCRYNSGDNSVRIQYLHSRKVAQGDGVYNYRRFADAGTIKISIHTFDHIIANLALKTTIEKEYAKGLMRERVYEEARQTLELMRFYNLLGAYRKRYIYRQAFSKEEHQEIERRIRLVLSSLNPQLIPLKRRCKFGYWLINNYQLMTLQENIFSALRKIIGFLSHQ